MSRQAFDRAIAQIEDLRAMSCDDAREPLRKALKARNNYLVGKAAAITGEKRIEQLIPDLIAAFDRFMRDPVASDPQCWAKNGIARALKDLEHDDPEVFQRGIAHFQYEPVWGTREDTAGALRSTCAFALSQTRLETFAILKLLTDLLADPETSVRVEAARALAHLGARDAELPLRLKARSGGEKPEVTGACFSALLDLKAVEYVPFVAAFFGHRGPEVRLEAAAALSLCPEPAALRALLDYWSNQSDPEHKGELLSLLAGCPVPEAADFLLEVARDDSPRTAARAIEALARSRY